MVAKARVKCARRPRNIIMRVSRNEIRHNPASLGGVLNAAGKFDYDSQAKSRIQVMVIRCN